MRYFTPWCTADKEWLVGFDIEPEELFKEPKAKYDFRSSYHILGARLFGMPYADYLLYCVKTYNAMLRGKVGWCHLAFKTRDECDKLCRDLEKEWDKVLKNLDLKYNQLK